MNTVILILFSHFIADFVCQTDKMALGKSTSNKWLSWHVTVYMIAIMFWSILWTDDVSMVIAFILINGALHWVTDYFTSRLSSYLWKKEMRHWFFVCLGIDQFIHGATLIKSYELLFLNPK